MDSFKDTRRQIYIASVGILIIFTIGVIGFMLLENKAPLDALWLTTITLTTVGYGDDYAQSAAGRIFTIFLILTGFGLVAFGLQATATFLVSPEIRDLRSKRRTQMLIRRLGRHYVICGNGELVDQSIQYLMESVRRRLAFYDEELYGPIDTFLDRVFGDDELGHYPRARAFFRRIYLAVTRPLKRIGTLLDLIVVVTEDPNYARKLREDGFLVIEGTPTRDETLLSAGIDRAIAIMVMLPDDTDTLLTVLTARSHNPELYITAATIQDELAVKALRIGANNAIRPFELAGQFLNNVTLRPTVYDFFNGILFDNTLDTQTTQVALLPGSAWIGKRIEDLQLKQRLNAAVIGIHNTRDEFIIAPNAAYRLSEGEDLVIVAPSRSIQSLKVESRTGTSAHEAVRWQKPHNIARPKQSERHYTLDEAAAAIQQLSKHFIICGNDEVSRSAIQQLDPERPFVIVSNVQSETDELLGRGFCVVHGDPSQEETLLRAGADRALAVMISLDDEADTVLTVIACRSLSKQVLITATANSDETVQKLYRIGADRIISPFNIAAQVVLLSTTRPMVTGFFQYVLYNRSDSIETTELYMQDNSPWIGLKIADLRLERLFRSHVIGIRKANGIFEYAPDENYEIRSHEVLVIVTPMVYADELRLTAHGSDTKRPDTLRRTDVIETTIRQNPLSS